MVKEKVQIGAKQFAEILGPWCPKGIESSPEVEEILAGNPPLFNAVEESLGMLLQELCMDYEEGGIHGKFYTARIAPQILERPGEFDYYYLVVITNGDPGVPKGRAFLLLPEEFMANELLWGLLKDEEQKAITSVVSKKAGLKH